MSCRIGEASNPGPEQMRQPKQRKLGDLFVRSQNILTESQNGVKRKVLKFTRSKEMETACTHVWEKTWK
eukprot:8352403-Heterocapsa_arctica.AAC.1